MRKRAIIISCHLSFWLVWLVIQALLSSYSIWIDFLAVFIYTVPFYLNYWIVLPLMPKYKYEITIPLSLSIYFAISIALIVSLYELFPAYFVPLEVVGKGMNFGVVLHLSFVFYPISSISKILVDRVLKEDERYKNELYKVSKNIAAMKSEMSFNLVGEVLEYVEGNADLSEQEFTSILDQLTRIVDYRTSNDANQETVSLQEEVKYIQDMMDLIQRTQNKSRKVFTHDNYQIKKGLAFEKVEEFIAQHSNHQGLILITSDAENIWVSGR